MFSIKNVPVSVYELLSQMTSQQLDILRSWPAVRWRESSSKRNQVRVHPSKRAIRCGYVTLYSASCGCSPIILARLGEYIQEVAYSRGMGRATVDLHSVIRVFGDPTGYVRSYKAQNAMYGYLPGVKSCPKSQGHSFTVADGIKAVIQAPQEYVARFTRPIGSYNYVGTHAFILALVLARRSVARRQRNPQMQNEARLLVNLF